MKALALFAVIGVALTLSMTPRAARADDTVTETLSGVPVTDTPKTAAAQAPSKSAAEAAVAGAPVIGSWGFQVTGESRLLDAGATTMLPGVGARYWLSETAGFEAGLSVAGIRADGDTDLAWGVQAGYLLGLATSPNMTLFVEPLLGLNFAMPSSGDVTTLINLRGNVGAEIRLGMIGVPKLALTTRLGLGVDWLHEDNGDNTIMFGTTTGTNTGLRGLFEGSVGFVVYL